MTKLPLISFALVLSVGALTNCGGGSSSGVNSGVDPAKPADDITDDEAERICEAMADYAASQLNEKEVTCKSEGLTYAVAAAIGGRNEADMQAACQDAYDGCMEDAPEPDGTDCSDATGDAAMCDDSVTVGDVETCATDKVDAYAEVVDQIPSCSEITMDKLEEIGDQLGQGGAGPEQPASCDDVVDACPGLSFLG